MTETVSLDALRERIVELKDKLETKLSLLGDAKWAVTGAREELAAANREFNAAVAATKPKRKSPAKKVDTGAAFHPAPTSTPSQVDLEEAIARESADRVAEQDEPVYRPSLVA